MRQQVCKQRVYRSLKYRFGSQKGFFLINCRSPEGTDLLTGCVQLQRIVYFSEA